MKDKIINSVRKFFTWGTLLKVPLSLGYIAAVVALATFAGSIYMVYFSHVGVDVGAILVSGWCIIAGVKMLFDTIDASDDFANTVLASIKKSKE